MHGHGTTLTPSDSLYNVLYQDAVNTVIPNTAQNTMQKPQKPTSYEVLGETLFLVEAED